MTKASTDLVTIEGTMTNVDVLGYFEHPDRYEFSFAEDPAEVAARIEAETLAATSAADLFGEGQAVLHALDVLGTPLQFLSVSWRPSDLDGEGLPFFALGCGASQSKARGNCGVSPTAPSLPASRHRWLTRPPRPLAFL